jgi:Asp-tRNA(Asn)/Glu-tRNA(Gln) amidotransferase A subunit family amidase
VRVAPVAHHDALAHPARGLTVGVPRARLAASARPVPAVERAFEAALDVLRAAGLHVVDVDFPPLVVPEVGEVFVTEAHMIHAATLAARPQDLGIDLQQLFALPGSSGARFVEATAALDAYAAAVHEVLETTAPVVVLPTTRQTAAPIGAEMVRIGDDDVPVLFAFGALTVPFNVAHVPALSLPCGVDDAGLPIGLQIVGRPFDETTVLRVGHTYQQATDWHRRRPPEP